MKVKECISSSIPSCLRLGLTSVIVFMVISSPVFMFANPTPVLAATNSIDSSGYHSTPLTSAPSTSSSAPTTTAPPVSSQGSGDFTTQAALSLTRASQTNNFVASKAYYDISFRTATTGPIKSVVMDFPAGTVVGSANLVEVSGIGTGTIAASAGEVLTYTVTNAVNVPANTIIRIQISNINNPTTPGASFTVSITTRDAANTPIDGPTPTFAYNMVQVGNAQIAPGAVTTTKIATGAVTSTDVADGAVTTPKIADFSVTASKLGTFSVTGPKLDAGSVSTSKLEDFSVTNGKISQSFMRSKQLADGQNGWNPNNSIAIFSIADNSINANSHIFAGVGDAGVNSVICGEEGLSPGVGFDLTCSQPPSDGAELRYTVIDQPNT